MLQDWQQRVVDELAALDEKGQKLGLFLISDTFKSLPFEDKRLLQEQAAAIRQYASVLRQRTARFQMGGEPVQLHLLEEGEQP